ncbi:MULTISPECIES: hormogonium polysaccharide biosynthesis glycosyltransferase HpsE [unclassified Nostoc]|uniref:hormogonium polysaccharide biosynthesis glycosyltransferase HpsE n=1 Tax=unclassified Nostoc TaxID=2593658 RepID=UPI002AD520FB|nr:hormogonium polysaccharide biosynthesis glycosyltransferase HpsE [Nostoc sp. DedQUE03]MDZ7972833.1 hormogonium polysaccharide biosynthesis glycosyltransferase HpsE [Nostoc sp. DedQUE03]MDZ8045251.1 hormogonium polysaccharide biosynthesis glycosyltransferase HpsE [Nostoc sp. DedQUE02]
MTTSTDFTVAICTYNGEKRLPEVLELLRTQVNIQSLRWEVIVIDNNSTDNTAKIVQEYQANWSATNRLIYCFEPQQGAAFARKRAIHESHAELIGFLDDDNLPALDWVAAAYAFAQEYPKAGAYGSQIHPNFEVKPPENFHRIAPFLAITERGSQPLLYEPRKKLLPPSAGVVVRKQAWLESVPVACVLTGRVTGNMLTSEDLEVLSYIQKAGWEIWYTPTMQVHHKIPSWRLQRDYLIPFFRGIGLSRHVTRMISVKPWLIPLAIIAYMTNDIRKILFHLLKYRTQVKTDLVAACEMELILSSLISPIYLWKTRYLNQS